MGILLCPVRVDVADCHCANNSTAPGAYVTGAWLGWSELTTGSTLADIAALTAPEDPRVIYTLFGSADTITCPTSGDGMTAIGWGDGGAYEIADLVAAPVEREGGTGTCIGGVILLTAALLGISDPVPLEDGDAGSPCDQTGGYATMLLVARDTRGRMLLACPFAGIRARGGCDTVNCCAWNQDSGTFTGCNEEHTLARIQLSYSLNSEDCECIPSLSVTVDGESYTPEGSVLIIDHEVTPCEPGQVIDITTDIEYDGSGMCAVCVDSHTTDHETL